jgi:hypothetical protein
MLDNIEREEKKRQQGRDRGGGGGGCSEVQQGTVAPSSNYTVSDIKTEMTENFMTEN